MLLVFHNLTPHVHDNASFSTEKTELTWLGWLNDLFDTDLGEGHLECFTAAKAPTLDASAFTGIYISFFSLFDSFFFKNTDPTLEDENIVFDSPDIDFAREWYARNLPLRAPPTNA